MKKLIFIEIILVLMWHGKLNAQINLVPNPSFEDTVRCPNALGGMLLPSACKFWYNLGNGSSDYYNSCYNSNVIAADVPNNVGGWQSARTGIAYAGFITNAYSLDSNVREYIATMLDSILIENHKYCIEFYASMANALNLATNNIGMYVSDTSPPVTPQIFLLSNCIPQINALTPITDTSGWVLISGEYIAHGGEHYITIGNFYTDAQTDTVRVANQNGGEGSYYYIDDVSIVDCSGIGINEVMDEKGVSVYPNPNNGEFTIRSKNLREEKVKVYTMLGDLIKEMKMENGKCEVDMKAEVSGMYFVEVKTQNGVMRKKFVKE